MLIGKYFFVNEEFETTGLYSHKTPKLSNQTAEYTESVLWLVFFFFFWVQEHKLFSKSFMAENLNMHDWEAPW